MFEIGERGRFSRFESNKTLFSQALSPILAGRIRLLLVLPGHGGVPDAALSYRLIKSRVSAILRRAVRRLGRMGRQDVFGVSLHFDGVFNRSAQHRLETYQLES